ncbi:hypothetical protein R6Q57_018711 [Mikania cordata]
MSDGFSKACCKFCDILLPKESNTTLKKHIHYFCEGEKENLDSDQTQIGVDGGMFMYDVNVVRDRMSNFVIQEDLSFDHFDNPSLMKMIRETLQHRYTYVSHTTHRCIA